MKTIVVTGAAGFIGSCLVSRLNKAGYENIVVVDDFSKIEKSKNLEGKSIQAKIGRKNFGKWLSDFGQEVEFVYHIGARTDTTEFDTTIFDRLNVDYSKEVWKQCVKHNIPLVYASSAATYGLGEHGYKDDHDLIEKLKPLNPYGDSKNDFDKWAIEQTEFPPFWAGLKFFNVYGPNEFHKGRMASVVFHAFNQIGATDGMKLFRSHNPEYKNGEQLRDFIYVKDVIEVCLYLKEKSPESGLYNLGSGIARTFLDLTKNTFKSMGKEENISFVDTPEDIRDKYQYFTKAEMSKLVSSGYDKGFHTLEEGVKDYVENYLSTNSYY
ncbi:MAG: ADP-glyceromanno-heptose 6-epimerase [Crocinitomicaceae bacterium]|nr:ADP-glyceromanno-heptose 6-epimerase [Crocinitomicaceae bacterium]